MAEPWVDTDVLTAAQLAGLPWGVMGYVNGSTSDQSGVGVGPTDITGLSVTFTAVSTRLYRTTMSLVIQQVTSAASPTIAISDGAGTAQRQASVTLAANDLAIVTLVHIETGISGSITRKGRIGTGAGTVTVVGTSQRNATFVVEDLGPG